MGTSESGVNHDATNSAAVEASTRRWPAFMALSDTHKRVALSMCKARRRLRELAAAPTTGFQMLCKLKNFERERAERGRLEGWIADTESTTPEIASDAVRAQCDEIVIAIPLAGSY